MFVKSRSDWYNLNCNGLEQNIIDTAVHEWRKRPAPCLCSHSGPTLQAILLQAVKKWLTGWNVSQSVKNVNKMCFLCVMLIKQWYRIGLKSDISLVVFSPGIAETNVGWSGKLNDHLMASCVRNIRTKIIKIWQLVFKLQSKNVGDDFLRHSVGSFIPDFQPCFYYSTCCGER